VRHTTIELGLRARSGELGRELQDTPFDEVPESSRPWLVEQYRVIVPLVLPAVLRAVETGEPLAVDCLEAIRASAQKTYNEDVPLAVVLRGGLPALRIFTAFLHERCPAANSTEVLVAMGRGALLAHELGVCWAEAWNTARLRAGLSSLAGEPVAPPSAAPGEHPLSLADGSTINRLEGIELHATSPDLDDPEQEMLVLAALGQSNSEIARATRYSRQAVGWHLSRLMRVWSVPNRTALVTVGFLRGALVARRGRRGTAPMLAAVPAPVPAPDAVPRAHPTSEA